MNETNKTIADDCPNIVDGEAIKEKLSTAKVASAKTKRGRPKKSTDISSEPEPINEALYNAENWMAIASLYHNVRYAMTGHDAFLLSIEQQKILGTCLAEVMKTLIVIDPKYVALSIFAINLATMIGESEIKYRMTKNEPEIKS